ncbi:hypothetical protein HU200_061393 [Digitaria exilis]|uniref:Protein kinase domain-containing protein n=1 Tax=Digitaria exilis TaxID=1010633 RepID=A0A835A7H0_9POAL|nr:hypothetical protein HU200_061393 [Digitaria exilis]
MGSFQCSCPPGTKGNASIEPCRPDPFPIGARLGVGCFAGLLVALIVFLGAEVFCHKQRNKRQGYFEQHGGEMLSRFLIAEGNTSFKFYDREHIVKATRNFHKSNIIGEGAHGTVYKAILSLGDDTMAPVAVKRCKQIDTSRTKEFIQELMILCRVNHLNIVRLLGCCLHFQAPMLVYEFVPNGTLNDLLHGSPRRGMTLATRLRIAAETAVALAHLHSRTILHGDVKPENILLGDRWVAKVSDFGCSTIDDNTQVVPKGSLAYLDPEFLDDFSLTDKTDVYSFGVVLMELLTRRKPRPKEQKNLTKMFEECMGNGNLCELLDADVVQEGYSAMEVIHQTTELARLCTAVPGKERPPMGQVAEELQRLSDKRPEDSEAIQALEGHGYSHTGCEADPTGFYSIDSRAALSTELAR